jgi:4,4'-diaponeurosporenoate glycosyltransferase
MMTMVVIICWVAGFALLWKVPTPTPFSGGPEGRAVPRVDMTAAASPAIIAEAELALIIPARNEELNLPRLLGSITTQDFRPSQVVVVDDDSTDATAAVSRSLGASVIAAGPLPEGWNGKTWAMTQGATAIDAKLLLFLDADTWFETNGLARITSAHAQTPAVLSVLPYHHVPTGIEQLSAFFNLIMAASVGGFGLFARHPNALFGQMLLIDRATYASIGGHEKVRQHVLENVHLAAILKSTGATLRCLGGRGCLSMRMYPGGSRDLVAGWTKGFASGAGATSPITMLLTILWLSGAITAVGNLRIHGSVSIVVYSLFVVQIFWMLRQIGSYWLLTAILYPVSLIFFFLVFGNAVLRSKRGGVWKGRALHAG